MTENDILFLDFPSDFDRLREARKTNRDLDTACQDFAAIKNEILRASQNRKPDDARFLADLSESLEDLRHEIQAALARNLTEH